MIAREHYHHSDPVDPLISSQLAIKLGADKTGRMPTEAQLQALMDQLDPADVEELKALKIAMSRTFGEGQIKGERPLYPSLQ